MEVAIMEAKTPALKLVPTNVNACLHEINQYYNEQSAKHKVTFQLHMAEAKAFALVDKNCFRRVINNLFENALKFTNPFDAIQITVENKHKAVQIIIIRVQEYLRQPFLRSLISLQPHLGRAYTEKSLIAWGCITLNNWLNYTRATFRYSVK